MPVVYSKEFSCCLTGLGIVDLEKFKQEVTKINGFDKSHRLNEDSKLVLLATQLAIENARINIKDFDPTKIGVVMSTMFGSFTSYENFYNGLKADNLQPQEFAVSLASTPSSVISIFFKLKGINITFSGINFCDLIDTAKMLIKNKICEIVFMGFWIMPSPTLLSYTGVNISPFCVVGVVESIEIAKKRKYNIYLVI